MIDRFVDFAMSRVRMLIHFGITPYLVFDGDYLPSKAATEIDRAKRREDSKRMGLELLRMGKPAQAQLELQKAVDVTPEMARQLIDELKYHNVQFVVAPYEADAQMVYLEKRAVIQGIISEDSDLLVFGAKCLLTKLDQYGECVAINRNDFTACKEINLVGWSDAEFRRMAILSGCDYLPSINKMGLKTAYRLVRKHRNIEKILRTLQFDGQFSVPPGYLENFRKAELTFLHQRVFCPDANKLVMVTDPQPGENLNGIAYVGGDLDAHIALGVARGDLNPMTKKPIVSQVLPSLTPKSAWKSLRRQSVGTPCDLKPNKSIESYYKPHRTPLAELDPNSFTPSPSQQRLLERQTSSWSSSSVSDHPVLTRSTASLPASRHFSLSSPRDPSTRSTAASTVSLHPPKRQRLCEESTEDSLSCTPSNALKIENVRSRFFASPSIEQTPSIKSNRQSNALKLKEINVWSDDLVEDALVRSGNASKGAESTKTIKIAVHQDAEAKSLRAVSSKSGRKTLPGTVKISQSSSSISASTQDSQLETWSTPASLMTNLADSQPIVYNSDQGSKAKPVILKDKSLNQQISKARKSQSSQADNIKPVHLHASSKSKWNLQQQKHQSVAQFVGMQRHDNVSYSAYKTEEVATVANPVPTSTPKRSNKTIHVLESPEIVAALSCKGSEDFMVPNSEDEMDENGPAPEDEVVNSKLDLDRFTFTK